MHMINRKWGIFFFVSLILIFLLSTYWIYSWKETERKLRMQKELELSDRVSELAQTQDKISDLSNKLSDLSKKKDEIETRLISKIAAFEASSRDYDMTIKGQTEKLNAMNQENDSLKNEIQEKDKMFADLSKKVYRLNAQKAVLSDKIQDLEKNLEMLKEEARKAQEAQKAAVTSKVENPESLNGADLTWIPDVNTVDLGKIVIQELSGHAAQVQHVDGEFGFIVINAGTDEGLKYNSAVNILRDNKLIGKAVVQKARSNVCTAIIIPQFTKEKVMEGDVISVF